MGGVKADASTFCCAFVAGHALQFCKVQEASSFVVLFVNLGGFHSVLDLKKNNCTLVLQVNPMDRESDYCIEIDEVTNRRRSIEESFTFARSPISSIDRQKRQLVTARSSKPREVS